MPMSGQTQLCPISQSCVWNTSGLCHFDSQWHHERLLLKAIVPPAEPNVQNPCANHRWPFLQRHYKSRNKSIQILPKTNQNPPKKESIPPKPYRSTNTPKPTQTPTKTLPKIMSNTHQNPPKKLNYQNHTKNPPKPQQRLQYATRLTTTQSKADQDTQNPTKTLTNTPHIPTENLPKTNQTPSKNQPKPERTKMKTNLLKYPKLMKTLSHHSHRNTQEPSLDLCLRTLSKAAQEGGHLQGLKMFERMLMTTQGATFLFCLMSETGTPFRLRFIRNPYVSVSYSPHSPHGFKNPRSVSHCPLPLVARAFFRVPPAARFRGPKG